MAPSISHTVVSESQITTASLKASTTTEEVLLDNPVDATQDPASVDPLATTTSVPSSDDDMDETGSIDGSADNASDAGADVTPTAVAVAAATEVAAEASEVVADETSDFDNEVAAVTSFAEGFSLEDRTSTVKAPAAIERTQTSSTPSSPSSTPQPIPVPAVEALIAAASTIVGEEGQEARKSLSRPLSRQELRRKSSFFNSKDIAISDQRFSSSTSASMRPIADPRFKSRFQNILSQWKARASE
ncbi:hypothetical protein BGZ97_001616 [Linnemannia gamsii]|jgi:hypothetical protein|uniref:Uncharacterized protein n=1 Tax=Linnemannia gamsii TaxID=64522 RepID=A0A9P6UHZ6_9FUNG|nr:hypothetical protein BGZ97_001616 [Linnemannia gamsii]